MQNNLLICYICHQAIKNREEASYIGKDEFGKEKYRHRKCSPKLKTNNFNYRREWKINPKTKIKESDTLYNRQKEKKKFKKDYESD